MCLKKIKLILSTICICFILNRCATAPVYTPVSQIKRDILLTNLIKDYGFDLQQDCITQVITLKGYNVDAHMLPDSRVVILNGNEILLNEPVFVRKSMIVVPEDFIKKVIQRMRTARIKKPDKKRIVPLRIFRSVIIDAGHGGKDPGAVGKSGIYEKDVVLDIAKRLKTILKKHGLKVSMTRTRDKFVSLKERTEMASKNRSDLFISIHANANPVRGLNGMEIYYAKKMNFLEKNEPQRKENQKTFFKELTMKKNDIHLENMIAGILYDNKLQQSQEFAQTILKRATKILGTREIGVKDSRFFVLRNTLVPAVLVEVGFLSNPKEEKFLKQGSYRQKVAYALARGVLDYIND